MDMSKMSVNELLEEANALITSDAGLHAAELLFRLHLERGDRRAWEYVRGMGDPALTEEAEARLRQWEIIRELKSREAAAAKG